MNQPQAVVQIGLHRSCEYLYLVDPKYRKWPVDIELPAFESANKYHYYGVEMNDTWIRYHRMAKDYKDDERVSFIHALVHGEDNKAYKHDSYTVMETGDHEMKGISLDTLFSQIPAPVSVLAIDIEGAELDVIRGYSFYQCPNYIIIEVHTPKQIFSIGSRMRKHGYRFARVVQHDSRLYCGFLHKYYYRTHKQLFVDERTWRFDLFHDGGMSCKFGT